MNPRLSILIFAVFLSTTNLFAQSLGLNNATPDASSILDLSATNRGLLIPRMTTINRTAIAAPADGLLVYDTDLDAFYYYDATAAASWRALLADSKSTGLAGWSTLGNSGTTAGTNFLGTADGTDLVFKTSGAERLRIFNGNGLSVAALAAATSTGIDIGALSGATANTGLNIGTISTGTANKAINIGAISGGTSNIGLNVGAISGGGVASSISTSTITATGSTAHQLNLGGISGANATSHAGLQLGNISGATTNAYGINVGTLTGGTTANTGLLLGAITSTGAANSYGIDVGAIGGNGTNVTGINIGSLSGTGTSSSLSTGANAATGATAYQLNLGGLSGANTTSHTGIRLGNISGATPTARGIDIGTLGGVNGTTTSLTGINIGPITSVASSTATKSISTGAISGGGTATYGLDIAANTATATSNYGVNIGAITGAGTTNYGLFIAAPANATNYNYAIDARGTIVGALPCIASNMTFFRNNGTDTHAPVVIISQPSTNKVFIRAIDAVTAINSIDANADWDAENWTDLGSPALAAGTFIMGISISMDHRDNNDEYTGIIFVRSSNGKVYWNRTTADNITIANFDAAASWAGWTELSTDFTGGTAPTITGKAGGM